MPSINDSKCILVIGATSGIGRALALAIHALPSKPTVLVAGRRKERLDELVELGKKDGEGRIAAFQTDLAAGRDRLENFFNDVLRSHPDLDAVIFSSGIQNIHNFNEPEKIDLDKIEAELNINYLAVVSLIKFSLPHFLKLSSRGHHSLIVLVGSVLALLPVPVLGNYCASKAASHALFTGLNQNLKETNVHIMELVPPRVESEHHDHQGNLDRLSQVWMPLDEYTKYAIEGLQSGEFLSFVPAERHLLDEFERRRLEIVEERANRFKAANLLGPSA